MIKLLVGEKEYFGAKEIAERLVKDMEEEDGIVVEVLRGVILDLLAVRQDLLDLRRSAARRWRWTSRRSFYRACRRTSAMPSQAFSRRIRGRTTRAIRSAFTAWRLPGLRCASASRTALCMWWR